MDLGEFNLQTMVDPAAFPKCKNRYAVSFFRDQLWKSKEGAEDTTISSPEEADVRYFQNHCCRKYVV
jgi:hypothetical protein